MDKENIPRLRDHLPEMVDFLGALVGGIESGEIDSWRVFKKRVSTFFLPGRMEQVESVVPGWGEMASFEDGVTLVHVTSVFAALFMLPEYRKAPPGNQALMEWVVLFHDITKRVERGERDFTHGFRSAAAAGQALPRLGFAVRGSYGRLIDGWSKMTREAITQQDVAGEAIQDNRKLPDILAGIDKMFGQGSPTARVVKAILLHMSIDVVKDWPQTAPLSDEEIKAFVRRRCARRWKPLCWQITMRGRCLTWLQKPVTAMRRWRSSGMCGG